MRHGSHRVAPQVGQRAVRGFALDGNIQAADHGHFRSFANADAPHWELRHHMHAIDFPHRQVFKSARLDHFARAALALLRGLEHEHHIAPERRTARVHRAGEREQRGHVAVVPAGVHLARMGGGKL